MKRLITTLFALVLGFELSAQDPVQVLELDLKSAKAYAIKHNKNVQSAMLDHQKSGYAVKEAIGQGLPQISATVDYNTYFNYEAELAFGTGTGLPADQLAQLDALMAAGSLQEQALYQLNRPMLLPSEPTLIEMDGASSAKLQVSQLLFSGQYWTGIQMARLSQSLNEKSLQKTEQEIENTITQSYYITLITEQSIQILDSNISNMEETLGNTERLYQNGIAESTDVDQIKLALSMLSNSKKSLQRSIELNYNMLRMQLGASAETQIVLTTALPELMEQLTVEDLIAKPFEVQNHIDYQLLEGQETLIKKQVDMQKWAYAPTLAGFYSYNEKILTTDFDMNPNHVAGVNLSIPIFTGGVTCAKVSQAQVDLAKSTLSKQLVEDQLKIQEQQLRFNLINAYENYQNQQQNVELSKRVYDNIMQKHTQGIVSTMDLTQANDNYLNAQNNYLSSIMELLQAKQQLEYLLTNSNK